MIWVVSVAAWAMPGTALTGAAAGRAMAGAANIRPTAANTARISAFFMDFPS
ncbi:MAG: hypothetical protein KJ621_16840 [Proteobacteria bacterium]|nr:hypothetical protein [Pseudomonadota bacterium]